MSDTFSWGIEGENPTDKPKRKKKPSERMIAAAKEGREIVAAPPQESTFAMLARISSNPDVDPDKMERLMAMIAKSQYHTAMLAMRPRLPIINKDGKIVTAKGAVLKYSSFEHINETITPILQENNCELRFQPRPDPQDRPFVVVKTILSHGRPGEPVHEVECDVPMPVSSASPLMGAQQAMVAAISYAKRVGTIAILNLQTKAKEDRDVDGTAPKGNETFSGPQAKKALKAIDDNDVPSELVKKYYLDKYGVTAIHELPSVCFDDLMASCKNYGEKHK